MKIKITELSEMDAYYNLKENIIGNEYEVTEITDWGDGWYLIQTSDPTYPCFYKAKYERVEES